VWDIPFSSGCEIDQKLFLATNLKNSLTAFPDSDLSKDNYCAGIFAELTSGFDKSVPLTEDSYNEFKYFASSAIVTKTFNGVTNVTISFPPDMEFPPMSGIFDWSPHFKIKPVALLAKGGSEVVGSTEFNHQRKVKQIYLRYNSGVVYAFDLVSASDTVLNLTSTDEDIYDNFPSGNVFGFIEILVGVAVDITTNRFYASGGAGKARFTEGQFLIQDDVDVAQVAFSNNTPDDFLNWSTHRKNRDVIRTWVPGDASVGRYILSRIRHGIPGERFELIGLNYVYRDLGTFRTTKGEEV
jgi:hypothetical protein